MPESTAPIIAVGYDGSEPAAAALRWAVAEAQLRGAGLRVIHAWQMPFVEGFPHTGAAFDPLELERGARELLEHGVAAALAAAGDPALDVEQVVACGPPAALLLEWAKGAELVVVGSRGLGGFRELLLGSVSDQVSRHAACPVVIVRGAHHDA